jgi:hypothetical protein
MRREVTVKRPFFFFFFFLSSVLTGRNVGNNPAGVGACLREIRHGHGLANALGPCQEHPLRQLGLSELGQCCQQTNEKKKEKKKERKKKKQ